MLGFYRHDLRITTHEFRTLGLAARTSPSQGEDHRFKSGRVHHRINCEYFVVGFERSENPTRGFDQTFLKFGGEPVGSIIVYCL